MRPPIAVLDACVLYPAPLRDTLVSLAAGRLFRAHWTDAIHEEWVRNVLADRKDITADQLNRTRLLMDRAVRGALVTGYGSLIDTLALPDPDDRHVLAAAIYAGADHIVTFNHRDFPRERLTEHRIITIDPDQLVVGLLEFSPQRVVEILGRQRARLVNPLVSVDDFLATLADQKLQMTVERLLAFREQL